MRTNEEIEEELEYLRPEESVSNSNANYSALTAELMYDCRRMLALLSEASGVPVWELRVENPEEDDGTEGVLLEDDDDGVQGGAE